jgi:hypothetical protein
VLPRHVVTARLRLRVSSCLYYGFTFTLRLHVPWRQEPMITTRLHPLNNHLTGSLSFCCVLFRRSPSLRLRVSSRFYYGFMFTLPFRVSFVTSWLRLRLRVSLRLNYGLRSLAKKGLQHDYSLRITTITTRLLTSNNHLAGSLTFCCVLFRHVLLRVCDFAFHPRTKIVYFTSFY